MKRITASVTVGACLLLPLANTAFATGQPGAPAVTCFSSAATALAPSQQASGSGATVTSPGSVFNEDGTSGQHYAGQPGTPSAANGSPKAISQYDVGCLRVTTQVP